MEELLPTWGRFAVSTLGCCRWCCSSRGFAPSPPLSAGLGGRPLPTHPRSSGLKESVNLSAPNTSVRNQSSRNLNKKVLLGDPFQYSTEENWKKRLVYMAVEPALASCSSFPFREGFWHRFVALAPCCRPSPSRHGLGKWVQSPEPSSSRANALPRAHGVAEPPACGCWRRAGPSTVAAELGLPQAGCRRPLRSQLFSCSQGERIPQSTRSLLLFLLPPLLFFSFERYYGFHFIFFLREETQSFFFFLPSFRATRCYLSLNATTKTMTRQSM